MPSPFPGMDPYLEDPAIWPDLHNRLAYTLSEVLNQSLPAPYYARLESRPEVGLMEGPPRRIIPDVSVQRGGPAPGNMDLPEAGGVAVAEPRARASTSLRIRLDDEPIRHQYVVICDSKRGGALVTLIEIVSPSNKQPGHDRLAYQRKQQEVLASEANLIEIDLHGGGRPVVGGDKLWNVLAGSERLRRYVVAVSRSWQRDFEPEFELYLFGLAEPLPCIQLPLREHEDEPLLDLQVVFQRAYDAGPYRRGAVDYAGPPVLGLDDNEQDWVRQHLYRAGVSTSTTEGSGS